MAANAARVGCGVLAMMLALPAASTSADAETRAARARRERARWLEACETPDLSLDAAAGCATEPGARRAERLQMVALLTATAGGTSPKRDLARQRLLALASVPWAQAVVREAARDALVDLGVLSAEARRRIPGAAAIRTNLRRLTRRHVTPGARHLARATCLLADEPAPGVVSLECRVHVCDPAPPFSRTDLVVTGIVQVSATGWSLERVDTSSPGGCAIM